MLHKLREDGILTNQVVKLTCANQYAKPSTGLFLPYNTRTKFSYILKSYPFMPQEWNSGASSFCPVCLSVTLSVTLWQKNFNFGHYFWTVKDRHFIFGMHTQLMKPFQMTPRLITMWPWPWSLTYISKNFNPCHNCWTIRGRAFVFHVYIPCDKSFLIMPSVLNYCVFHLVCVCENRQFLSTGIVFSKNVYSYLLKAPSRNK